jgi:hypothetical protein
VMSSRSRLSTFNRFCRHHSISLQIMTTAWIFACVQRRVVSSVLQLEAGADANSFAAVSCFFPFAANIRGQNEISYNPLLGTPDMRIDATPQISTFLTLSRFFQSFKRVCYLFPRIVKSVRARMQPRDNFYNMSTSFYKWSKHTKIKDILHYKLSQPFYVRQRIRGLNKFFKRWAQITSESKRLKSKAKTVIYRIKNACAAKCMSQWINHVRNIKKAKRLVGMLVKKGMVCCFYEWHEYVKTKRETAHRLQHAAKKVLGKWMFGGMSRSFERWAQITSESKRLKSKAKTVIYRIKNACAAKSFDEWHQCIKSRKETAAKGRLALCRIVKFCTAKSFSHWACVVREAQEKSKILRKVIFQMMHNTASRCFHDWLDKTQVNRNIRNLDKSRSNRHTRTSVDLASEWLQVLRVKVLKKRILRVCWRITQKRWNSCIARQILTDWKHLLRHNSRQRHECISKAVHIWKRRVFAEFAREIGRKKMLHRTLTTIQTNRETRVLWQATELWARSSERSSEISRCIDCLASVRRKRLMARAFCIQSDAVKERVKLERKISKALHMKLLAKVVVLWYNDAAKGSIVTKRSLSSSQVPIAVGNESSFAAGPQTPLSSRRRASLHAYSQFMNSQLRRASLSLESSFSDNIALTERTMSMGDLIPFGSSRASHGHESPVNHNVKPQASKALRPSDL